MKCGMITLGIFLVILFFNELLHVSLILISDYFDKWFGILMAVLLLPFLVAAIL